MQVLEAAVAANPWPLRRERAAELAERYSHAAEMLRLYQALTIVQESGQRQFSCASSQSLPPPLAGEGRGGVIAAFAAEHALPAVIDVTVEAGPRPLRDGAIALYASANREKRIRRWLTQRHLQPIA